MSAMPRFRAATLRATKRLPWLSKTAPLPTLALPVAQGALGYCAVDANIGAVTGVITGGFPVVSYLNTWKAVERAVPVGASNTSYVMTNCSFDAERLVGSTDTVLAARITPCPQLSFCGAD